MEQPESGCFIMRVTLKQCDDSSICGRCGQSIETAIHAIRDCPQVANVWLRIIKPSLWSKFFQGDLSVWLDQNFKSNFSRNRQDNWRLVFGISCWIIWIRRNLAIFQPEESQGDAVIEIQRRVQEVLEGDRAMQQAGVSLHAGNSSSGKWEPPDSGWLKLNVDGACRSGGREIACAGVLRDSAGQWIKGFAGHAGEGSVVKAELLAILGGLKFANEMMISHLVLETDSAEAGSLIMNGCERSHPYYYLVAQITHLMKLNWSIKLSLVYRESNRPADLLARKALRQKLTWREFTDPLDECISLLLEDMPNGL